MTIPPSVVVFHCVWHQHGTTFTLALRIAASLYPT